MAAKHPEQRREEVERRQMQRRLEGRRCGYLPGQGGYAKTALGPIHDGGGSESGRADSASSASLAAPEAAGWARLRPHPLPERLGRGWRRADGDAGALGELTEAQQERVVSKLQGAQSSKTSVRPRCATSGGGSHRRMARSTTMDKLVRESEQDLLNCGRQVHKSCQSWGRKSRCATQCCERLAGVRQSSRST